jgi:hypothetical protein
MHDCGCGGEERRRSVVAVERNGRVVAARVEEGRWCSNCSVERWWRAG